MYRSELMAKRKRKMTTPLTDEEWAELMKEQDAFKLAIRGHAALEAEMDTAIGAAFVKEPPSSQELGTFPRRLKLAVAMGIIHPDLVSPFEALNELRNEIAHSVKKDVTAERTSRLVASFALSPERLQKVEEAMKKVKEPTPRLWLAASLGGLRTALRLSIVSATERREAEQKALASLTKMARDAAMSRALINAMSRQPPNDPAA